MLLMESPPSCPFLVTSQNLLPHSSDLSQISITPIQVSLIPILSSTVNTIMKTVNLTCIHSPQLKANLKTWSGLHLNFYPPLPTLFYTKFSLSISLPPPNSDKHTPSPTSFQVNLSLLLKQAYEICKALLATTKSTE